MSLLLQTLKQMCSRRARERVGAYFFFKFIYLFRTDAGVTAGRRRQQSQNVLQLNFFMDMYFLSTKILMERYTIRGCVCAK